LALQTLLSLAEGVGKSFIHASLSVSTSSMWTQPALGFTGTSEFKHKQTKTADFAKTTVFVARKSTYIFCSKLQFVLFSVTVSISFSDSE